MLPVPTAALPLIRSVAGPCVLPTAKRLLHLMVGAILTTGRRTISHLLRAIRGLLKILTPVPGGLAFSLGTAGVTVEEGTKTS